MLNALEELEDLEVILNEDEDEVEETIIFCYLGIRLKPLQKQYNISDTDFNSICNNLADNYFDYDYSIDIMVAAVYNYYKAQGTKPSEELLTDNIDTLLDNFGDF